MPGAEAVTPLQKWILESLKSIAEGRALNKASAAASVVGLALISVTGYAQTRGPASVAAAAEGAYPPAPSIPAIGVRNVKYLDLPAWANGPAVDPAKGYRLQDLGQGLYMVTDNVYQSLFLEYDEGVVVVDAPPNYAGRIPQAVAEVSSQPITHVIYSHSHTDHIGGTRLLGGSPIIIAHQETRRLLERAADPNRPLPTVTFGDRYTLRVGQHVLELSYYGDGHEPGNIFIRAPAQRVLMVVDVVFPGWMPWRRLAVAHDVPGHLAQVERIRKMDWQTLVAGHVARTGTHADVELQADFYRDLKAAAAKALSETKPAVGMDPRDTANPWAVYDHYIDRVAAQCVNSLTQTWASRLAAFDVYVWDQCYAMEQSLRID
jgi:glyoxylase-like metal-dependent hydrolase (beta-lactamase superfamily II)